jgi:S-adenosylhomocysteine hydrolase
VINETIKANPGIFKKLNADLKGISEETTTGVLRLY